MKMWGHKRLAIMSTQGPAHVKVSFPMGSLSNRFVHKVSLAQRDYHSRRERPFSLPYIFSRRAGHALAHRAPLKAP